MKNRRKLLALLALLPIFLALPFLLAFPGCKEICAAIATAQPVVTKVLHYIDLGAPALGPYYAEYQAIRQEIDDLMPYVVGSCGADPQKTRAFAAAQARLLHFYGDHQQDIGEAVVRQVPAGHREMVTPPSMDEVAAALSKLEQASK